MLSAGEEAPGFELPALVHGEVSHRSLSDYVGDDVVVLAFYPADFNPACDADSCDLEELDLFTMQKDVSILGVSPDSVYSHRRFAAAYDLNVPLLSDTERSVGQAYGVTRTGEDGTLLRRAVFVIDLHGVVQYAWATDDLGELPNVEPIRAAISEVGGDSTALSRYKVGYAHYREGRRAFTSAMNAFADHEWMKARKDFQRAREEFEEAEDEFDTALRFSDAPALNGPFEQARLKAQALWQAAEWLADSANAHSSGQGAVGQEYREDAETPLTSARNLDDPLDPSDISVADGEVLIDGETEESIMEAIRQERDAEPETAGGVDLEVEAVEPDEPAAEEDDDEDDQEPIAETDAARRAREYGGKGVEMDAPSGAGDDQIADALAEATEETGREGANGGPAGEPVAGDAEQNADGIEDPRGGTFDLEEPDGDEDRETDS